MKQKNWLSENREWLFSGLAVYLLGLATSTFKEAVPLLTATTTLSNWTLIIVFLLPASVLGYFCLRSIRRYRNKIKELELGNSQSSGQSMELALKDPLTDLWNLRKLQAIYADDFPKLIRSSKGISGMLIDIDEFNKFQQPPSTFRQGSKLLKQVASVLQRRIGRPNDFLIKYGGDEFLVIVGDTPIEGVRRFAELIQKWLQEEHFYIEGKDQRIPVRVSIGITQFNINHDTTESFEDRLYLALQEAKSKVGKNAIAVR